MINLFCILRQLEYETILNKKNSSERGDTEAELAFTKQARQFMKPVKFVQAKLKGVDEELPRMPNTDKLWPIVTVDLKNSNVLNACFHFIFECVQKHVELGQRVSHYTHKAMF